MAETTWRIAQCLGEAQQARLASQPRTLPEAIRAAVPPLEFCLPLHTETKRATAREASGAPRFKSKLTLYVLALYEFQEAAALYGEVYLTDPEVRRSTQTSSTGSK